MKTKPKKQKIHSKTKRLHLAHHRHSGRPLPHGATSYRALLLLVAVVAGFFITVTAVARAQTVTESGSITIGATVPGPPPTQGAQITSAAQQAIFQTNPISLSGTCEPGTIVRIWRNGVMAGSTFCSPSGTFQLQIDLVRGRNDLQARNFDALEQAGPDTPELVVIYQPAAILSRAYTSGEAQSDILTALQLSTDYSFRGLKPQVEFSWPFTIIGGKQPYAVKSDWGDKTAVKQQTISTAGKVDLYYTYARAGRYQIKQTANDAAGQTAFLQLAAVVDGFVSSPLGPILTDTDEGSLYQRMSQLMPWYWAGAALLAAFWVGSAVQTGGGLATLTNRKSGLSVGRSSKA